MVSYSICANDFWQNLMEAVCEVVRCRNVVDKSRFSERCGMNSQVAQCPSQELVRLDWLSLARDTLVEVASQNHRLLVETELLCQGSEIGVVIFPGSAIASTGAYVRATPRDAHTDDPHSLAVDFSDRRCESPGRHIGMSDGVIFVNGVVSPDQYFSPVGITDFVAPVVRAFDDIAIARKQTPTAFRENNDV